eukprot:scaffold129445_cov60-Phaeocystis_antarctica.AAC.3
MEVRVAVQSARHGTRHCVCDSVSFCVSTLTCSSCLRRPARRASASSRRLTIRRTSPTATTMASFAPRWHGEPRPARSRQWLPRRRVTFNGQ